MDMYNVIKTEPDTHGEIVLESESRLNVGLMFDKKYRGEITYEIEIRNGSRTETVTPFEFFRRWMTQIRNITGLSQAVFAREYGIPRRSIENWESRNEKLGGATKAPAYVLALLERAVREDYGIGTEEYTLISDNSGRQKGE